MIDDRIGNVTDDDRSVVAILSIQPVSSCPFNGRFLLDRDPLSLVHPAAPIRAETTHQTCKVGENRGPKGLVPDTPDCNPRGPRYPVGLGVFEELPTTLPGVRPRIERTNPQHSLRHDIEISPPPSLPGSTGRTSRSLKERHCRRPHSAYANSRLQGMGCP